MPTPETDWEQTVTDAMHDCINVFGEGVDGMGVGRVIIQHAAGGPAYEVDGIFEAESLVVEPESGAEVITNQPMISFALSDLQRDPLQHDLIVIRGISYRVVEPDYDGQGTVTLRLNRL